MILEVGYCSGIENYSRHLDGRKPGEKPYEWKEADASLKQAYTREKRERVHKRTNATEEDRPRLCLLTDVEAENLPRQHGFLGDILFADSIAFLYGPSGIWKTFVALDWGLTSAAGGYWFDHEISQGSAVFITGEGAANVGTRITDASEGLRDDTDVSAQLTLPAVSKCRNDDEQDECGKKPGCDRCAAPFEDTKVRSDHRGGDQQQSRGRKETVEADFVVA
jgi:hypothetical protein